MMNADVITSDERSCLQLHMSSPCAILFHRLGVFIKWYLILNKRFKHLTIFHNILHNHMTVFFMFLLISFQLISQGPEETITICSYLNNLQTQCIQLSTKLRDVSLLSMLFGLTPRIVLSTVKPYMHNCIFNNYYSQWVPATKETDSRCTHSGHLRYYD